MLSHQVAKKQCRCEGGLHSPGCLLKIYSANSIVVLTNEREDTFGFGINLVFVGRRCEGHLTYAVVRSTNRAYHAP